MCTWCLDLAGAQDALTAQDENKTWEHRGRLLSPAHSCPFQVSHPPPQPLHVSSSQASESLPLSQDKSNNLILVPSFLNLFSCLLMGSDYKQHHSSSSRSVARLFTCFPFCSQEQHLLLLLAYACQALHYYTRRCQGKSM